MNMQQKVQNYIQKHQLLTSTKPIVVGVSGGTDSVVLLHILVSLGYDCVIAHCNFHLRMEESNRDDYFVRNLATELNIPIYCIDFQTTEYAKEHGISIEMAARDLRYNWFADILEKCNAQAVAVAHHADDSIETMLMNLVRGTGLRGLTGIAPKNKNIIRPLLCCTRSELEKYLMKHKLSHVEDSTNALSDYKRNKIRNEVLPLLEEINPSVRESMYSGIQYLNGTLEIYQQAITQITNSIVDNSTDTVKLSIEKIKEQVHIPTIMYELLYPYGFSSKIIEQITEHLDSKSGKIFNSETHRLVKDRKFLIIELKNTVEKDIVLIEEFEIEKYVPFRLKLEKLNKTSDFQVSKEKNCIHIDAAFIKFPLTVRSWQDGDFFYPFGMSTRKKISDFLIDNKFSLPEKEQVRLLMSGDDIIWIIGWRTDNRFKVTNKTREVLEIRID